MTTRFGRVVSAEYANCLAAQRLSFSVNLMVTMIVQIVVQHEATAELWGAKMLLPCLRILEL